MPKNMRNLEESSGTFSPDTAAFVESAEAVEGVVEALGDARVDEAVEAIMMMMPAKKM